MGLYVGFIYCRYVLNSYATIVQQDHLFIVNEDVLFVVALSVACEYTFTDLKMSHLFAGKNQTCHHLITSSYLLNTLRSDDHEDHLYRRAAPLELFACTCGASARGYVHSNFWPNRWKLSRRNFDAISRRKITSSKFLENYVRARRKIVSHINRDLSWKSHGVETKYVNHITSRAPRNYIHWKIRAMT